MHSIIERITEWISKITLLNLTCQAEIAVEMYSNTVGDHLNAGYNGTSLKTDRIGRRGIYL